MPTLTETQEKAIQHPATHLQLLACAGAGKTEVLARRAVRLLTEGADPRSVLAFTFTEKAAKELKQRIETRAGEAAPSFKDLPPGSRGMFIGTTHSWALGALQDLGGRYATWDAISEEQEWALLHRFARRLGVVDLYAELQHKAGDKVAVAPAVDVFLHSMEVVHNERIDRRQLQQLAPRFASVLQTYERLLIDMRLVPFRLMIGYAADELKPGGSLRTLVQGRLRHVLVDEFQDFNRAQDELLGHFVEAGTTLTLVADDDQAIYQWRGGDVSLFVSFAQRRPDTEPFALAENHRSRPEIVSFARLLVEKLPGRLDKALGASREASRDGAVEVVVAANPQEEARLIANRIVVLTKDGHRPGDIAVLYRSVRTSALPLVQELRDRGIPTNVVGKTSLLARPEMALIARVLVYWGGGTWYPNPQYEAEVVTRESLCNEIQRVTRSDPASGEAMLRQLEDLGGTARREGVFDSVVLFNQILVILGLPGTQGDPRPYELGLGRMSELLTEFDHAVRRAAPREIYESQSIAAHDEADEDAALAADRSAQRKSKVLGSTVGEIYFMRLRAFLEEFAGRAAEEVPDTLSEAGNAIQIMTVHQAKGLEFPIVFVPALVEGRFPSALMGRAQPWFLPRCMFDCDRYEGREEDEARLLYVALTRAKELLVVSWFTKHRVKAAQPSRFLTRYLRAALQGALPLGSVAPAVVDGKHTGELLETDFSSLITYQECGYRYRLRYVCGFQPPLVPELGFGKLLHHVISELARHAANGQEPTSEQMDKVLGEAFYLPFAGPVPAKNLREAARRRLRAYVDEFGTELSRVIQPERRFEVPLANARIRGRIDLMLRADGGGGNDVELIDFKTSANRPPSEAHMNQLRIYAAAANRMGYHPVRLVIHDLDADSGGRIPVPQSDVDRSKFEENLREWVEGIGRGVFKPTELKATCRSCDFRQFCPHAPSSTRNVKTHC
jgi:ATP-dependent DNA helicase UvrD/PcrA